ncbi:hypothetical protein GCM10022224_052920 [Nonomuraea antimicrobica]|uniref:Uncharacterized protein n=1 Tax=Nonomuraea antimicrobica TaxID=561173 RepID=A0ABP7CBP6_9ACTN
MISHMSCSRTGLDSSANVSAAALNCAGVGGGWSAPGGLGAEEVGIVPPLSRTDAYHSHHVLTFARLTKRMED